jgi:Predicted acetyltransferase
MNVISVREHPEYKQAAIRYFQEKWATEQSAMVYENCIHHALLTDSPLPQWYLLEDGDDLIGCAGLIPNDFISRMDLWPWICALYIEKDRRGQNLGALLIDRAKQDARTAGFQRIYISTGHIGYYEHYGFKHIGTGYHPWGDSSRIYEYVL